MSLKRDVIASGVPQTRMLAFHRSDGPRYYNIAAFPVEDSVGRVAGVVTAAVDVTEAQR